jgi:hypothetical protein
MPTRPHTAHAKYIRYPSQPDYVRLIYMTEVTSKQARKNIRLITTIKKLSAR